uniref:Uncharacterized protein n=1 Tax=Strigamia maritima TaxID=126957 RepID=T1JH53_STRMM
MLDEMTAYGLLTTNSQIVGSARRRFIDASVAYQPMKMGMNEMMAADTQTMTNMIKTRLPVILRGYSRGLMMA